MQNNIIDVQCTVVRSERVKQPSRYWGVFACFLGAIGAGGAGLGLWPGSVALGGLLGLALVLLLVAANINAWRRPSQVFALTAVVGIAGVILAALQINAACSLFGLFVAGMAMLVISKIELRGWTYE